MMQIKFLLFFTLILMCCTNAAVYITQITENVAYPGHCWDQDSQTAVKPSNTIPMKNVCGDLTCGTDFRFRARTCGAIIVDDNCKKLPEDLSKPYPACCSEAECTD